MNLQNDELAIQILEAAKKFDETAHAKAWKNPNKQRPVADLHFGEEHPEMKYRSEIRCAKKKIYWYIGTHTSISTKYARIIEKYEDKEWKDKWGDEETRRIFNSSEDFFSFVDECLGKND